MNGQCLDQPSEPEGNRFHDRIKLKAYKAEELGGFIFAYMGPDPVPLLPRYDVLAWDGERDISSVMLPCNWLQCQENSLDPLHFQWLHRYFGGYMMNLKKPPGERDAWNAQVASKGADHRKIGFEITDYGVIKRRLVGDETEDDEHWRIGHPILFPNILRVARGMQFRVPVDDTHTLHLTFQITLTEPGEEPPDPAKAVVNEPDLYDEDGRVIGTYVVAQDQLAWVIQGPVMDRTTERLGVTDVGIIMYRRMLETQMKIVEDGGEPMNVLRDPAQNDIIVLPCEYFRYPGDKDTGGPFKNVVPRKPDVVAVLSGEGARREEFDLVKTIDPHERYYVR